MKSVIALVGRPNVGKSTLFNRLTRSRAALVADQPGLTRDRIYGTGKVGDRPYIVIDTGGLGGNTEGIEGVMAGQVEQAIADATVILVLVDGRKGLTPGDEEIIRSLRQNNKKIILVINKTEGIEQEFASAEFYELGLEHCHAISASHGDGVADMMETVLSLCPHEDIEAHQVHDDSVKVAVVGRPNVGKSTLVNCLLGEKRVLAFDEPGTTRDSIYIPFEHNSNKFTLIDTAGLRRRGRISEIVEKFSVIKTLQAIEESHVVILVLDAQEGVLEQDVKLLGMVLESGKALVLAINKWDGLESSQRNFVKSELDRKLTFIDFAIPKFISAKQGSGVDKIMKSVLDSYQSANRKLSTSQLTRKLEEAVEKHAPPLVKGRRIKLRYAHQGGHNPPLIIVHGNQTESVPVAYQRYLANYFHKAFKFTGTPLQVEFKKGDNPFEGKKNMLTRRQLDKRKRLKRHVKKSKK
ncbi:MAG: ribosome biogenesis GTPase Der [Gammaproteobacteria bacterium]